MKNIYVAGGEFHDSDFNKVVIFCVTSDSNYVVFTKEDETIHCLPMVDFKSTYEYDDKLSLLKVGMIVAVYDNNGTIEQYGSIMEINGEVIKMNDHRDCCATYTPTYNYHYTRIVISEHQY